MSANDWKNQKNSAFKRGGASKPFKRGGAPRPLSANIPDITKKTLGKRGLAEGGLITDWVRIVGPELAASCQPERLAHPPRERSGGTLHIRVYGGAATELQHLEPLVLERINGHFGYRAVAKLRLIHAPLSGRSERVAEPKDSELPPLDSQSAAELDALLAIVDDPELRASLGRIGRAIMARSAAATRR
jgi:hypothetical protein